MVYIMPALTPFVSVNSILNSILVWLFNYLVTQVSVGLHIVSSLPLDIGLPTFTKCSSGYSIIQSAKCYPECFQKFEIFQVIFCRLCDFFKLFYFNYQTYDNIKCHNKSLQYDIEYFAYQI